MRPSWDPNRWDPDEERRWGLRGIRTGGIQTRSGGGDCVGSEPVGQLSSRALSRRPLAAAHPSHPLHPLHPLHPNLSGVSVQSSPSHLPRQRRRSCHRRGHRTASRPHRALRRACVPEPRRACGSDKDDLAGRLDAGGSGHRLVPVTFACGRDERVVGPTAVAR